MWGGVWGWQPHLDHVVLRNALRDAHRQRDLSSNRLQDRGRSQGRRHEDHGRSGAGLHRLNTHTRHTTRTRAPLKKKNVAATPKPRRAGYPMGNTASTANDIAVQSRRGWYQDQHPAHRSHKPTPPAVAGVTSRLHLPRSHNPASLPRDGDTRQRCATRTHTTVFC